MTTVWEQAQAKQSTRRERGKKRATEQTVDTGMFMDVLTAIGNCYHVVDQKGNNTTAVGIAHFGDGDPVLYLSFKGPPQPNANAVFLMSRQLGLAISLVDDIRIIGNTSGLHSEMAIVSAATGGDRSLLINSEFRLEIACVGKGVCPDCSGFLQKYGVAHTKTRSNVASDWVNPFTRAHYTGTGNSLQYVKGGQTFAATTKPVQYHKGWARS